MFIGHFGVAIAAKRISPSTSLAALIFSAEFLDLIWPLLLLLGWEHVRVVPGVTKVQSLDFYDYPYSHSLTMALGWGALVGLVYFLLSRNTRGALTLGVLVVSHWVLDFISHRPDMPLWPHGPKVGLGLWNSWVASISVEVLIFAAAIWLYLNATRAKDRIGSWCFCRLITLLCLGWVVARLAPPPPDVHRLAVGSLSLWITVPWAWWADAHRDLIGR